MKFNYSNFALCEFKRIAKEAAKAEQKKDRIAITKWTEALNYADARNFEYCQNRIAFCQRWLVEREG